MAEISTIARPYAEALFRVAERGSLTEWAARVEELAAVAGHPDMSQVIGNPKLSDENVYSIVVAALDKAPDAETANFLRTLIENGRVALLPEIARQFHDLKNAKEGRDDAHIYSAFPMDAAQTAELIGMLEKKFGIKLVPEVTVDPSLIGGVRVVVGDQVLDTSVRSRLDQMRHALTA